jgi:hypothetical protein
MGYRSFEVDLTGWGITGKFWNKRCEVRSPAPPAPPPQRAPKLSAPATPGYPGYSRRRSRPATGRAGRPGHRILRHQQIEHSLRTGPRSWTR